MVRRWVGAFVTKSSTENSIEWRNARCDDSNVLLETMLQPSVSMALSNVARIKGLHRPYAKISGADYFILASSPSTVGIAV